MTHDERPKELTLIIPLWHGVYAPAGQAGCHVDVVEEDGARVKVVGPTLAAQWVDRDDVVPSLTFQGGSVTRVGEEGEPPRPDPTACRQLPFFPFTWGL